MTTPRTLPILPALLALAACGSHGREVDRLDHELLDRAAAAGAQPAAGSAKPRGHADAHSPAGEIVVDPAVVRQAGDPRSRDNRPSPADRDTPASGTRRTAAGQGGAGCYAALSFDRGWAARLPRALALPRGASVGEAAGEDAPGCRTRIVSYAIAAAAPRLVAFYAARGRAGGYAVAVERHAHETIVAGDHRADARAFYVTLTPCPHGGTDVDLVSNDGR